MSDPVLGEKHETNIIHLLSVVFADSLLSVNDDIAVSIFITHSIKAHRM